MSLALPWVCHWIFSVPGVALHFQKTHVHLEDALPAELLPQLIWPTILGITHLGGVGHQKEHSATQRRSRHTHWLAGSRHSPHSSAEHLPGKLFTVLHLCDAVHERRTLHASVCVRSRSTGIPSLHLPNRTLTT